MRQAQPSVDIDDGDREPPRTQPTVDLARQVALAAAVDAAYSDQCAVSCIDLSPGGRNPADRRLYGQIQWRGRRSHRRRNCCRLCANANPQETRETHVRAPAATAALKL